MGFQELLIKIQIKNLTKKEISQLYNYNIHISKSMIRYLLCIYLLISATAFYNSHYRKCRLNRQIADTNGVSIEEAEIERVVDHKLNYQIKAASKTQKPLEYINFSYYYHEFIGAGGSGQVYLVEDEKEQIGKVMKRYFKQRSIQFQEENYIMNMLNYQVKWSKDCGDKQCDSDQKNFHTLAIFPYRDSIVLRSLQYDDQEFPLIFYKTLKQLSKCHRNGIVHHDIKMGNILVNSMGPNFKFYEVQLIDWNLAIFYYSGYDSNVKHGTTCYYSPEQTLKTSFPTPAIDVWALGVVFYTYLFDEKPFKVNCKVSNLKAIVSLVGGNKIVEMVEKYRYYSPENMDLILDIKKNPEKYPPTNFESLFQRKSQKLTDKNLIEVFKRIFVADPEERATIDQLINMKYFKKIKRLPQMYYQKQKGRKEKAPKDTAKENKTK